jgi:phage terminase large subunit-like protein
LNERRYVMPSLHPGQAEVARHAARFKVLACGRRWGKTRLGTALCVAVGLRGGRAWWTAPSYKMGAVGWRGVQMLAHQIPGADVLRGDRMVTFPGGGTVQVRSADDPQSLRGEGLDFAVLDECAYMREAAWSEALRPTLSDRRGGALFISTPRGLNWFRELWMRGDSDDYPEWQAWRFHTLDNPYIVADEIDSARRTLLERIFRQEYEADFLEDNPGALWKREWLDAGRLLKAPDLATVAVSVDPAGSASGDACGIVAGGMAVEDGEQHLYVIEDATMHGSADEQARAAVSLYHKLAADRLIVEKNNGGDWIRAVIKSVDPTVHVVEVWASRGKHTRAEPIAPLYEQGRGHHVGAFPALEDELCQWQPGDASPNRLDALVWLATELITTQRVALGSAWQ